MAVNLRLTGVLDWLREGYPTGVPPKDYMPLLALLRRRLNEDEVREVAQEISQQLEGPTPGGGSPNGSSTDIGVSITKIIDALPSKEEIARVETHLSRHHGWPAV
jgi:hypothetical protein